MRVQFLHCIRFFLMLLNIFQSIKVNPFIDKLFDFGFFILDVRWLFWVFDVIDISTTVEFHLLELNFSRCPMKWISLLMGFIYLNLNFNYKLFVCSDKSSYKQNFILLANVDLYYLTNCLAIF